MDDDLLLGPIVGRIARTHLVDRTHSRSEKMKTVAETNSKFAGKEKYHWMYVTPTWRMRRFQQLREHPLCEICLTEKKDVVRATVVHHTIPHNGDWNLFCSVPLQSLCSTCHNSTMQKIEHGNDRAIGVDGWPVATPKQPFSIPNGLRPSRVLVHLVVGPPGSGKTTFTRTHAHVPPDVVIDLDDIREKICGDRYCQDPEILRRSLRARDTMLHGLAHKTDGCAWLVVMAPTHTERKEWARVLGTVEEHVCMATPEQCKERIDKDHTRRLHHRHMHILIDQWFMHMHGDAP